MKKEGDRIIPLYNKEPLRGFNENKLRVEILNDDY